MKKLPLIFFGVLTLFTHNAFALKNYGTVLGKAGRSPALSYNLSIQNDFKINENNMNYFLGNVKDSISSELMKALNGEFDLWYPLAIDSVYGGYFSNINYEWKLEGPQTKMIVTQARHVWSNSNAASYYSDKNRYVKNAAHGFKFLKNVMWDSEFGGFYNLVNREGAAVKENGNIIKRAYGNSFAIYGLAAYYKASGDEDALELARKAFEWLEKHSYDPEYGGYFQFLSREGNAYKDGYDNVPPKDQNTMIHILECFTELYKVWPDEKLRERLSSTLHIIRDVIATDKGTLNLFFNRKWEPVSFRNSAQNIREENYEFDHVSFGHDIETAYLMLEASEVLGIKNDTLTLRIAKKMVDHTLRNGWDNDKNGIFDRGYYMAGEDKITIIKNTKEWWAQVEALNSLLIMSELFPDDEMNYYKKFLNQWSYIKKYLLDSKNGGWYWGGIDIVPQNIYYPKSTIWKGNYHTSRALINCIKRLSKSERYEVRKSGSN